MQGQGPGAAPEPTDLVEVRTTAPDAETATQLARALVEARLAACVQVVPGVTSTYVWQGEVEEEAEHLLLVKSTAARFEPIRALLRSEHPYEMPEVLAVAVVSADPAYAAWVRHAVADDGPPGPQRAKDES